MRVESQSSDREGNASETSAKQRNATSVDLSENVNNIFETNLGRELTGPSKTSNEIKGISPKTS